MSDFQVGDVVERVGLNHTRMPIGTICRVTDVFWYDGYGKHEPCVALRLANWPGSKTTPDYDNGWNSKYFRKLPKADEQFTADLKARLSRYVGEEA